MLNFGIFRVKEYKRGANGERSRTASKAVGRFCLPIDGEFVGDMGREVREIREAVKVEFKNVMGQHHSVAVMAFLLDDLAKYLDELFTHLGTEVNTCKSNVIRSDVEFDKVRIICHEVRCLI